MNTIALVLALYESFSFLHTLEARVLEHTPQQTYWKSVSLTHSTITLTLHTKSDSVKRSMSDVYLKASFEIHEGNMSLGSFYCADDAVVNELRNYITTHAPKRFDSASINTGVFNLEVLEYIRIADAIAKQAYQCSSGDNYYPGYFSEMIIQETQIVLKQINRWNARSIDHKNDYHMRDLEFYIPLTAAAIEQSFVDDYIGRMQIVFSDRSTQNNKSCGDKIAEQMQVEKIQFESKK